MYVAGRLEGWDVRKCTYNGETEGDKAICIYSRVYVYVTTSLICVHIPVCIQVTQQDLIDVLDDDNASVWVGVQDLLALAQVIDRLSMSCPSRHSESAMISRAIILSLASVHSPLLSRSRSFTHSHAR